jgi:hypothetical protein
MGPGGITITPDQPPVTITPDQPSVMQVLTQPTDKTDQEYTRYTGPSGVAGATVKGLDDVARGTRGALAGAWDALRHPVDTAKSLAELPAQAAQVPAAIRDINQSPDPTGRYAQVAQDTASQGAGQALTALATTGAAKTAAAAAPYAGPVGGALIKGYAKKLLPDEAITAYKAVKNTPKSGSIADAMNEGFGPSRTLPGQIAPDVIAPPAQEAAAPIPPRSGLALPPAPRGAELADLPPVNATRAAQSGEALGSVKSGSIADAMNPSTPGFKRGSLGNLLDQSLGAKKLEPNVPLRQQMPATASRPQSMSTPASQPAVDSGIPEGHTPHDSSALRSSKYDADANEFHARMTSGNTTYVYGDVAPEEAQAFADAPSKGKAYQQIKSGHPLVAKIVDGKRIAVKAGAGSAAPSGAISDSLNAQ